MNLLPTPAQETLRNEVRSFLEKHCPPGRVRELEASERGFCSTLWEDMAHRGWLWLGGGGMGGSIHETRLVDRAVYFEELGRACTPGPFLSHYESILMLEELSPETLGKQSRSGGVRSSLALLEESGSLALPSLSLRVSESSELSGTKIFVPWVEDSDDLLIVARDDSGRLGLFLADMAHPAIRTSRLPSLDSERVFEVTFDHAPVELLASRVEGDSEARLERALARATILACAELAGAAAAALAYAVDYVGRREQFGRPIGSFQAVQHHCANMALDADAAHFAVMDAAARVDLGEAPTPLASRAKVICSEAARRVTTTGHQVLGGVGFLEEMDMQLWTRRVKVLESRLGTPDWHRERIADALMLPV